jgi:glutamate--cysteine ligase
MDIGYSDKRYSKAVNLQFDKLTDVNKTPAAKLVTAIKNSGLGYQEWVLNQSIQHSNTLRNHLLDKSILKQFSRDVKNSRKQRLYLEKHRKDEGSLEDYISLYYSNIC